MNVSLRKVTLAAAAGALALAAASASQAGAGTTGEIAFVRGGDIYTVRADGTGLQKLVGTSAFEHSPAYSPDGSKLAYVREAGGNAEIYVADADGTNAKRLTVKQGGDYTPAWSPDGTRIAFASNRLGNYSIFVMRADGTDVRRVAPPRPVRGGSFTPAWSPDGRLIAYSSSSGTPENPELYVVRPDGKGVKRLTRTRGNAEVLGDDAWPTWSPDGKRIAFSSNRTGNGEVWIMNANGTGQRRVAGLPGRDDWAPAFSPDGRLIAFHSLDAVGRSQLYLVRPDGKQLRRLGIAGEDPTWRPS